MAARYSIVPGGSGKPGDLIIIDHLAVALEKLKPRVDAATQTAGLFGRQLGTSTGALGQFAVAIQQARFGEFALAIGSAAHGVAMLQAVAQQTVAQFKALAAAASPTGLQSVNKAWDILAGTLGTLVLPAFVGLGAAALTLADALWEDLKPNLDGIAAGFADLFPAVIQATKGVYDFAESVVEAARKIPDAFDKASTNLAIIIATVGEKLRLLPQGTAQGIADDWQRRQRRENIPPGAPGGAQGGVPPGWPANFPLLGQPGGPKEPFNWLKAGAGNLRAIIDDMRQGMGGRAQFGGIAEKWKQLQQAGMSALDQKRLDMMVRALRFLERIAGKVDNLQPALGK